MRKITCKIDENLTIELRNVVEVYGHDDSIPFNADVYVYLNGKKRAVYAGYAYNDGWGGESTIRCENQAVKSALQAFADNVRTKSVVYEHHGKIYYLPASFDFLIDLMVEACLYERATEYDYDKNFVNHAA